MRSSRVSSGPDTRMEQRKHVRDPALYQLRVLTACIGVTWGNLSLFWQILSKYLQALDNSFSFAQAAEMVSATGLVLSGKLPTTTTILAKVRAGDLDPKLQPVSLLLARMETCPTCQLWISLLIRNNI